MTVQEELVALYYIAGVITVLVSVVWGRMITLRSWITWWSAAERLLLDRLRQVIREELER